MESRTQLSISHDGEDFTVTLDPSTPSRAAAVPFEGGALARFSGHWEVAAAGYPTYFHDYDPELTPEQVVVKAWAWMREGTRRVEEVTPSRRPVR